MIAIATCRAISGLCRVWNRRGQCRRDQHRRNACEKPAPQRPRHSKYFCRWKSFSPPPGPNISENPPKRHRSRPPKELSLAGTKAYALREAPTLSATSPLFCPDVLQLGHGRTSCEQPHWARRTGNLISLPNDYPSALIRHRQDTSSYPATAHDVEGDGSNDYPISNPVSDPRCVRLRLHMNPGVFAILRVLT